MIQIAEYLGAEPVPLWTLCQQMGVRHGVAALPFGLTSSEQWHGGAASGLRGDEQPWDYEPLRRVKQHYDDAGIELAVIESRPPLDQAKLGLEGRDAEIDTVCTLLENMGRLGIPVWCYEWMALFNWQRTDLAIPARGGALVTGYDHAVGETRGSLPVGEVSEDTLWENLEYFLRRVLPVAERANVKLAMHPDDPPLSPIRGVGRIMRSVDNFQRLIDLAPSPCNGITMCQGNFALMTDDLPATIRHFGRQNKIFFVHLRDVRGTPQRFAETFHDDGPTDLLACLRAYQEIGFDGVLRPDHVPTMAGEGNEFAGYATLGRLFAVGYITGLREAVYGKASNVEDVKV